MNSVSDETMGLQQQPQDEAQQQQQPTPQLGIDEGEALGDASAEPVLAAPKKSGMTIKIPSMMALTAEHQANQAAAAAAAKEAPVSPTLPSPAPIVSPPAGVTSPGLGSVTLPPLANNPIYPASAPASAAPIGPFPPTNQNSGSASARGPGTGGGAHPQLNDALAYLDRVKAEFHDQPEIYNKFLQIMRDFKVNSIDSNGVIYRLVHLFMGHKSLIEGFNAFLPKSHHIDPSVAETGVLPPHIIAAAIGSGITAHLPPHPQMLGKFGPMPPQVQSAGPHQGQTINISHFVNPASMPPQSPWGVEQVSHPPSAGPQHPSHSHHQQQYYGQGYAPRDAPPMRQAPQGMPVAPPMPAMAQQIPPPQQQQHQQPQQAEGKKTSPQFSRAFGYVKKIKTRFANDPETYKAFLAALHSYHKEQLSIHEVYEQVSLLFRDNPDLLAEFMQFLPEQDAAAIITKSSSRVTEGNGPALGRFGDIELKSKRSIAVSASKAVKRARQATAMLSAYPSTAGYVSAASRSPEESEFFEKVKAFLGSKSVYAEFLKCLNLFSQDILKLDDLLRLVNGFIGGSEELYGWFKRYIGLKESATQAAVTPSSDPVALNWKGTAAGITSEIPELNLNACKRIGSYRIFPKTHKLVKASGRTALCEEVLNDGMISCPTFTSEDSTFVGSKKNAYEEALFKCEDERFELDLLIDYNLATIAVFEPLVKKMEVMPAEEKAGLALGNSLGGTSEVIYRKAIRRIYGDKSEEIILGLKRSPSVALPIVLARLKQKDEEWRRLQRDWNKVWREVHLKNYYKALDHQGIEYKAADKRNFAIRNLIAELEAIQEEQAKLKERVRLTNVNAVSVSVSGGSAAYAPPSACHLEFALSDTDRLLEDLVRLVKVHIRSTSSLSNTDRKAVMEFFSTFVPEFFAWKQPRGSLTDSLVPTSAESPILDPAIVVAPPADDLSEDEDSDYDLPRVSLNSASGDGPRLLFANNSLFAFMRLVQMALERLGKIRAKEASTGAAKEKRNVVAQFLDLQIRERLPEIADGKDFYRSMLVLLKQLLEGDLDSAVFEEQARFMFVNEAYSMYTFDKLLQAIVKQAQMVLIDPACEQMIRLFDSWKDVKSSSSSNARAGTAKLSEYSLRLAAENLLAGNQRDSLFRIEYGPKTGRIGFHLLERLFDAANSSAEAKWSAYVDGFVKLDCNGTYLNAKSKVFLKRCLRTRSPSMTGDEEEGLRVDYNLECKICINTYKLFYVENTEDSMVRLPCSCTVARSPASEKRFSTWWAEEWEALGNGPVEEANQAFRAAFSLSPSP